jgi:hypothetical protein
MDEGNQSFSSYGEQSMSVLDDQSVLVSESEGDQISLSEMSFNEDTHDDVLDDVPRNADFPNEAYADLMGLVTKHNLSNAAGNSIIKFFNKHSNLSTSPLPKSIEKGRKYMDEMNIPTLEYTKTCVLKYNNKEYYLYYRHLMDCVKNILLIPGISQDFALNFKRLKVIMVNKL